MRQPRPTPASGPGRAMPTARHWAAALLVSAVAVALTYAVGGWAVAGPVLLVGVAALIVAAHLQCSTTWSPHQHDQAQLGSSGLAGSAFVGGGSVVGGFGGDCGGGAGGC